MPLTRRATLAALAAASGFTAPMIGGTRRAGAADKIKIGILH